MEMRQIGSLAVSVVGLGCNNFGQRVDEAGTREVVNAALEAGINFFDTADIYGGTRSEEYLGSALGERRAEVVVATKFGMAIDSDHRGARPEYIVNACAASLRRLGSDYIDLYWLHQPDPDVPIAETLGALSALKASGKVREIGCSNFTAGQLREAREVAEASGLANFVALQNEYSLLHLKPEGEPDLDAGASWPPYPNNGVSTRGTLAECTRQGMAFVPYFPLASGMLTGKYREGQPPPAGARLASSTSSSFLNEHNLALVSRLDEFAQSRNDSAGNPRTLLQLAFGYLLARTPVASVIAGATKPEQVRANAQAADWHLTEDELHAVETLLRDPEAASV